MIFMKTSTRTRMSFEVGIAQLGAQPMFLNANDIQLRVGETIKDTANVMSRYVDGIMIRTFAQKDVEDLAAYGQIPVINGLTDDHHPCQAHGRRAHHPRALRRPRGPQARLLGRRQQRRPLAGRGRRQDRHARRHLHARRTTGPTTASSPARRTTPQRPARRSSSPATCARPSRAPTSIYTDTFTSMGQEAEHDVRLAALRAYQVNVALLELAGPQVQGHALPAGALGRGDHRRGAVLAATRSSSTRPRTACTRRRRSWRRSSPTVDRRGGPAARTRAASPRTALGSAPARQPGELA